MSDIGHAIWVIAPDFMPRGRFCSQFCFRHGQRKWLLPRDAHRGDVI